MMTQTKAPKALPNELIDKLLAGYQKSEELIGENGPRKQFTKVLVESALQAEMTEHLVMANMPLSVTPRAKLNGKSHETPKGEFGELPIETLRDREGRF